MRVWDLLSRAEVASSMIRNRGFFRKTRRDGQLLALAAGKLVPFGADLVVHSDGDDRFQQVFFDQQLNNALVNLFLCLGVGVFGFSKKDIVQNGLRENIFAHLVETECLRVAIGDIGPEKRPPFQDEVFQYLGQQ